MRRVLLAVAGTSMGGALLVLFGICIAWQCMDVQAREVPQMAIVPYPCDVAGTELRALQLAQYEGPFWEDNTDAEVVGVAALVIENTGDFVAEGAVVLEWGEDRMVFEFYDLPSGERVLVLEKDRQPFRQGTPSGCYGWDREEYCENMGHISVEEAGGLSIAVINHTDETIPVVQICYKSCDPGSGMFIGGISYRIEVRNLRPEERRVLTPYHYSNVSSKVIKILTWVEK